MKAAAFLADPQRRNVAVLALAQALFMSVQAMGNILVGLFWNFAYIGGSTLLTTTYTPSERAKVQASHDFTVYAATASAAALSGVLAAKAGWTVINLAAVPLMSLIVLAALWQMLRERRLAAAQPAE